MNSETTILYITAASVGFIHTLTGPDHYLPFVVISKARNWSRTKTLWITFLCGVGHVSGSVILGVIGIATGIAVAKLEFIEGYRGGIAAWLFMLFGLGYLLWGLWKAWSKKAHKHIHFHDDGKLHRHEHIHENEHEHVPKKVNITPWILFIIFVFGPCEPLIPILMYPAAQQSTSGIVFVALVFSVTTISTMMVIVSALYSGMRFIKLEKIEKYNHAIAGAVILLSGAAIEFLGL